MYGGVAAGCVEGTRQHSLAGQVAVLHVSTALSFVNCAAVSGCRVISASLSATQECGGGFGCVRAAGVLYKVLNCICQATSNEAAPSRW